MQNFFQNLTELVKQYQNFIFVTHKNMDMDGFASCISLYRLIVTDLKQGFIIKNDMIDNGIEKALEKLQENNLTFQFVTPKTLPKIDENTLLFIIDVHKPEMLEYEEILKEVNHIVVIDHHIKNRNYIKNTILTYINSNLSSTTELMVEYMKYLNKEVDPVMATIMLAGIEIDTNSFNVKTTAATYEAAAHLMRCGADPIMKQDFLKEKKEDYVKRQDFVKNSFMIHENMAMCLLDDAIYEAKDLATIAEELLQFEDVDASFVIGRIDKQTVGVSARSLGKINVEKIMNLLGGGGHISEAAAQVKTTSIGKVKRQIIDIIQKR